MTVDRIMGRSTFHTRVEIINFKRHTCPNFTASTELKLCICIYMLACGHGGRSNQCWKLAIVYIHACRFVFSKELKKLAVHVHADL